MVVLSFRRKLFAVRVCAVVVDSVRRHDAQHEGQKNLPDNGLAPLSPKRVTPLETVARILAGIGVGMRGGRIKQGQDKFAVLREKV